MSRTLIIHPKDPSTTFLEIVYKNIPDKTVVEGGVSPKQLRKMMEDHDRVMMMGHGGPSGLFSVRMFPQTNGLVIDETHVPILKDKVDSVFIWCNADRFVVKHELNGFFSGMFISEVGEAHYCGLPGTGQDLVDESNYGFCDILSECINEPQEMAYQTLLERYGNIALDNPVAFYNYNRLYLRSPILF
jgi:hypothetical protein